MKFFVSKIFICSFCDDFSKKVYQIIKLSNYHFITLSFLMIFSPTKKPQVGCSGCGGLGVAKPVPDRVDRNRVDFRF